MAVKPTAARKQHAAVEEDLRELVSLLGETFRRLKAAGPPPPEMSEAFERAGLGKRHGPALVAVTLGGPLSVSDLAKRLGLGLSTTSAIVGELSRAGLLNRAEDEDDRRRTIVSVHRDCLEPMNEWLERALAPIRVTLERLAPAARADFMEGWRILHEEASRGDPRDDGDCAL
jgi:DNA-binding MarR family transcriptional regulator